MVGLALLLWTLVGTVKKVEDSLNFVWRVQRARSIPRRVMEFVALVTIGPLVVATVIGFSKLAFDSVASYTAQDFTLGAQAMQMPDRSWRPTRIVTGLFTAIYVLMPNTRVRFLPALGGALAAGMLWAAIGKAFTAMVIYTSRLTLVYAGFAVVVAVFVWTYLGWLILLAGAQLAFYLQNPNYLRLGHAAAAAFRQRTGTSGARHHGARGAGPPCRRPALDHREPGALRWRCRASPSPTWPNTWSAPGCWPGRRRQAVSRPRDQPASRWRRSSTAPARAAPAMTRTRGCPRRACSDCRKTWNAPGARPAANARWPT